MPWKSWLKQNGPPPTTAPVASVALLQEVSVWRSPNPTNMYSALTLQLPANAHSMPPPTVPVVTVFDTEVEVSQLPQPAATFVH